MPGPGADDFHWPATDFGQIQAQVQLALALCDPLVGCGLQRLDLRVVVS
jgi:hypothetical protein